MARHPLFRRRRRRGQRDSYVERLSLARRLRDRHAADRRTGAPASDAYVSELCSYVDRFGEHWARALGQSPFDFPELVGSVGPGWLPLVAALDERLHEIDPGYYIVQFKEKYGRLRVYVVSVRDEGCTSRLAEVADVFEAASTYVCEDCGAPGRLREVHGWWRTVCLTHAEN